MAKMKFLTLLHLVVMTLMTMKNSKNVMTNGQLINSDDPPLTTLGAVSDEPKVYDNATSTKTVVKDNLLNNGMAKERVVNGESTDHLTEKEHTNSDGSYAEAVNDDEVGLFPTYADITTTAKGNDLSLFEKKTDPFGEAPRIMTDETDSVQQSMDQSINNLTQISDEASTLRNVYKIVDNDEGLEHDDANDNAGDVLGTEWRSESSITSSMIHYEPGEKSVTDESETVLNNHDEELEDRAPTATIDVQSQTTSDTQSQTTRATTKDIWSYTMRTVQRKRDLELIESHPLKDAIVLNDVINFENTSRYCYNETKVFVQTKCQPCGLVVESVIEQEACGVNEKLIDRMGPSRDNGCTYYDRLSDGGLLELKGCNFICEKSVKQRHCCPGYWGSECMECPGGWSKPCGGRGKCMDGLDGDGTCKCFNGFIGTTCGRCKPGLYGPNCENACRCIHGECKEGLEGDGTCECWTGYQGAYCQQVIVTCKDIFCPNNSRCVLNNGTTASCLCNPGYKKDAGGLCQPINRCTDDLIPPCSSDATCTPAGPALVMCECLPGYSGDGFYCQPINPCQTNHGDCAIESTKCVYQSPGQSTCECLDGFERLGAESPEDEDEEKSCSLVDMCLQNSSHCHKHATCRTIAPLQVKCECGDGYVGNGRECFGNIEQVLRDLHETDEILKGQLSYMLDIVSSVYHEAFTQHGPFTVLAVTDQAFTRYFSTSTEIEKLIKDRVLSRELIRKHIIAHQLTLEELTSNRTLFYTLDGSAIDIFYRKGELKVRAETLNRRISVTKGNVVSANGVLHVIDQLLYKPYVTATATKLYNVAFSLARQYRCSTFVKFLKIADLLSTLSDEQKSFTVFAPSNEVWQQLPRGALEYLQSAEGKGKLEAVLKNHIIMGPYITATDLVNLRRFMTTANLFNDVSISNVGRIEISGNVSVTSTDMTASNGYIHLVDGLLLTDYLQPILPQRCDVTETRTVTGRCGVCHSDLKCSSPDDIPLNTTVGGCKYLVKLSDGQNIDLISFTGCQRYCNKTVTEKRCCPGFYGPTCAHCPGTYQNQCLGHGKCDDGFNGSGACTCDRGYYGTECEYCDNRNMFGAQCNTSCTCLHGKCDNRVTGSVGLCKPGSCQQGYVGINCDTQTKKCDKGLRCHAHAECVLADPAEALSLLEGPPARFTGPLTPQERRAIRRSLLPRSTFDIPPENGRLHPSGTFRLEDFLRRYEAFHWDGKTADSFKRLECRCKDGYDGTGTLCYERDPCVQMDRGGCHQQADCSKTGPGVNICRCREGWVGDGTYCYPATSCSNHTECHQYATCVPSIPTQYVCECRPGYHGNGTHCLSIDICLVNNGGCHLGATCRATEPGQAECTCAEGLGGDGYSCFGSIEREVNLQHEPFRLDSLANLLSLLDAEDNPLANLTQNYTLLAPISEALHEFINSTSAPMYWARGANINNFISYHAIAESVTLEELMERCSRGAIIDTLATDASYDLTCYVIDGKLYVNDAVVLYGDIPAINGYIHVISEVLEPWSSVEEFNNNITTILSRYPQFSLFIQAVGDAGLVDLLEEDQNEFTLFAPTNDQWIDVNETLRSKKYLKYYIVPDKYTVLRLQTATGHHISTLLGSALQRQLFISTLSQHQIAINGIELGEVTNIRTYRGIIHELRGLLIPSLNKCDKLTEDGQLEEHCCAGYYGYQCNQQCPGGADNVCMGGGMCSDGLEGTGQCICYPLFTGHMCDECVNTTCLPDMCLVDCVCTPRNETNRCHSSMFSLLGPLTMPQITTLTTTLIALALVIVVLVFVAWYRRRNNQLWSTPQLISVRRLLANIQTTGPGRGTDPGRGSDIVSFAQLSESDSQWDVSRDLSEQTSSEELSGAGEFNSKV